MQFQDSTHPPRSVTDTYPSPAHTPPEKKLSPGSMASPENKSSPKSPASPESKSDAHAIADRPQKETDASSSSQVHDIGKIFDAIKERREKMTENKYAKWKMDHGIMEYGKSVPYALGVHELFESIEDYSSGDEDCE
jgi:hypothetical protein